MTIHKYDYCKKEVQITLTKYFTPEGKHTCISNYKTTDICPFYGAKIFGLKEVCMINHDSPDSLLERENKNGFLIPGKNCVFQWER